MSLCKIMKYGVFNEIIREIKIACGFSNLEVSADILHKREYHNQIIVHT